MLYRAQVEAVNGISVKAGGKWLTCIGNKPVSVGDRVWTDGRVVFGNYQTPQQPIVITFDEEDIALIIMFSYIKEVTFYASWFSKAFRNIQKQTALSIHPIKTDKDTTYFLSVRSNDGDKFALLNYENHSSYESEKLLANATLDQNGNLLTAFHDGHFYRGYNDGQLIFDVENIIKAILPGFPDNEVAWWATKDYSLYEFIPFFDINGNVFGIAYVYYNEGLSAPTIIHDFIEAGNTFKDGWVVFFFNNLEYTIMQRTEAVYTTTDPEDPTTPFDPIQDSFWSTTYFEPYSLYLPVKNGGRGGYFSFDYKIITVLTDESEDDLEEFKGVKFWDIEHNFLFALTRDEILQALGDGWHYRADILLNNALPNFDFLRLATNDFLVLLYRIPPPGLSNHEQFLFRYRANKLTLIYPDNIAKEAPRLLNIVTVPKRKLKSTLNKIADALSEHELIKYITT